MPIEAPTIGSSTRVISSVPINFNGTATNLPPIADASPSLDTRRAASAIGTIVIIPRLVCRVAPASSKTDWNVSSNARSERGCVVWSVTDPVTPG